MNSEVETTTILDVRDAHELQGYIRMLIYLGEDTQEQTVLSIIKDECKNATMNQCLHILSILDQAVEILSIRHLPFTFPETKPFKSDVLPEILCKGHPAFKVDLTLSAQELERLNRYVDFIRKQLLEIISRQKSFPLITSAEAMQKFVKMLIMSCSTEEAHKVIQNECSCIDPQTAHELLGFLEKAIKILKISHLGKPIFTSGSQSVIRENPIKLIHQIRNANVTKKDVDRITDLLRKALTDKLAP